MAAIAIKSAEMTQPKIINLGQGETMDQVIAREIPDVDNGNGVIAYRVMELPSGDWMLKKLREKPGSRVVRTVIDSAEYEDDV